MTAISFAIEESERKKMRKTNKLTEIKNDCDKSIMKIGQMSLVKSDKLGC